ncbi:MAG: glutathione S-transferase family protein [Candidatus Binatus sp.]|uniref:glutathione S-transferase family protein n=1 Tax=Candidatus Binatus sp. TaxID=2811406 RepID=UPI002725B21F|nr:glutathione S-transferase family protein [Candidatus Binatus sp.]MDO8431482.1 glutathione S-transferase family protein [Candidatus Binatus sp.]
MKLYNMNLSNFATKSRLVIYEKGLNVEMVATDSHSAEYLKINPLGKIPTLDADGAIILESEVINEYLEEKYPTPALMPKSPEARAKVRVMSRFHDLYLEPPLRALFPQMNPKTRDQKLVADKLAEIATRLDQLDRMLPESGFACGADFTLADCAIAPTMFFVANLLPAFGAKSALEGRPRLAAWWEHVQTRPSVQKGLAEMGEAMAAMQRGGN